MEGSGLGEGVDVEGVPVNEFVNCIRRDVLVLSLSWAKMSWICLLSSGTIGGAISDFIINNQKKVK